MVFLAGLIDTSWYVLVAAVLAGSPLMDTLRSNSVIIDRGIGIVLFLLALTLVAKAWT